MTIDHDLALARERAALRPDPGTTLRHPTFHPGQVVTAVSPSLRVGGLPANNWTGVPLEVGDVVVLAVDQGRRMVIGLAQPRAVTQADIADYVDSSALPRSGGTLTGNLVTTGNLETGESTGAGFHTDDTGRQGGKLLADHLQVGRVSGVVAHVNRQGSDGAAVQWRKDGGVVGAVSVTATETTYATSSDHRLKDNVSPLPAEDAIARVQAATPVEFDWRDPREHGRGLGYIAHELQLVAPHAVTGTKDDVDEDGHPEYQGVDAAKLVPDLHRVVQYLLDRVEELEAAAIEGSRPS